MTSIIAALLLAIPAQTSEQAPPDMKAFLKDVPNIIFSVVLAGELSEDKTIQFDTKALQQYTYTETETSVAIDSKGNPTKTQTNVYEVVRGINGWQFYRKLISRNGVPITEAELQKQDLDQKKREQKQQEERLREERKAQSRKAEPTSPPNPEKQREDMIRLFSDLYRIQLVRREMLHGYPTVVITLVPNESAKPKDDFLKMLHHVSFQAWVTEADHQVVRVEGNVLRPLSFGLGLLAKIQPGSALHVERQQIAGEFWTLSKVEIAVTGKILLLKSLREREITEYSNFKKYTVDTVVQPLVADTSGATQ